MVEVEKYSPKNKIRIVTAASLFDGHDASINIMRRILQAQGCEVIHLGHNRSVEEVVAAALQEDVQGIAVSSYQGGHVEYFKYMVDLLRERGGAHIQVFGGGGGVIVPAEIRELHDYGVTRIYSPEDGQRMGLQGMIGEMIMRCDRDISEHAPKKIKDIQGHDEMAWRRLAQLMTALENGQADAALLTQLREQAAMLKVPVLGITGTGGAAGTSYDNVGAIVDPNGMVQSTGTGAVGAITILGVGGGGLGRQAGAWVNGGSVSNTWPGAGIAATDRDVESRRAGSGARTERARLRAVFAEAGAR